MGEREPERRLTPNDPWDDRQWVRLAVMPVLLLVWVLVMADAPEWTYWTAALVGFGVVSVLLYRRTRRP